MTGDIGPEAQTIDRAAALDRDARASRDRLERLLDRWDGPALATGPVRFIGLGSSRFAALVVAAALGDAGRVARVDLASLRPAPPVPGETVFAVSASGRTPEVVAAAGALATRCPVIAVTNDPASPLARAAARCLSLEAGAEESGIATLTYRATLATLALATGATDVADLAAVLPRLAPVHAGALDAAAALLDRATTVDVVAPAALIGAAEQAALMLREAPRIRAIAWDAGEWLHTAIYTALPGHHVLDLAPSDSRDEIRAVVEGRGGEVVAWPADDLPADPIAAAIVLSGRAEQLAAELWKRAGPEPESGQFKGA